MAVYRLTDNRYYYHSYMPPLTLPINNKKSVYRAKINRIFSLRV